MKAAAKRREPHGTIIPSVRFTVERSRFAVNGEQSLIQDGVRQLAAAVECGGLPPLWSAAACRRGSELPQSEGCGKPQHSYAVRCFAAVFA